MKRKRLSDKTKDEIVARQQWCCAVCGGPLEEGNIDFDHEIPLDLLGKDDPDNLQAICRVPCHRDKTKADAKVIAKSRRIRRKNEGTWRKPKVKLRSRGFDKRFKKKLDGTVVPREQLT